MHNAFSKQKLTIMHSRIFRKHIIKVAVYTQKLN